jgi:hypothetical protein
LARDRDKPRELDFVTAQLCRLVRRDPDMTEYCEHYSDLRPTTPRANGCEECLALGATWTELRVCLSCGHVGCCEDSEHRHALEHFHKARHPLIAPLERGETWSWCYEHRRYYELAPGMRPKGRSALMAFLARILGR